MNRHQEPRLELLSAPCAAALLAFALLFPLAAAAQAEGDAASAVRNSANTFALAEGASSPGAEIEDLGWLSGYWRGSGFGGHCELAWGEPSGDRMLGWVSVRSREELKLSDATAIVEKDGGLEVWVKHFTKDFVSWEEKNEVRLELTRASF
ncbi:MAG: DUF6265 family protein [Acidobacteriota bacterium]